MYEPQSIETPPPTVHTFDEGTAAAYTTYTLALSGIPKYGGDLVTQAIEVPTDKWGCLG